MDFHIRKATAEDISAVAYLFDLYRVFYKQAPDLDAATTFITERVQHNESVILLAIANGQPVGFTQLYPIFTSVGMKRTWLLNDLYVLESVRGNGVAQALLNEAKSFAKTTNSKWLMLQTGTENIAAQTLYEKNGWQKEHDLFYSFDLTTS